MKQISIDKVTEGMVTAKPVTDARGNLLIKEGFTLDATWVERLRNRGVQIIWVEAEGDETPQASEPEIRAKLDAVFADVIRDDLMLKIKGAVYKFLVKRYT
ncbi:MAG: hypothetical protein ACYS8W_13815 [Planctomycetota bacterium]|jgi:hypothetical protein